MRAHAILAAVAFGLAVSTGSAQDQELDLPVDPIARLGALDARIAEALSEVEESTAEKARIEAELGGLADGRAAANRRLRERTRALYRMTRAGVLPLAGGFPALMSHVARVERLERMVRRDATSLRDLQSRAEALRGETGRLTERIEVARARADRLMSQKAGLEEEVRRLSIYASAFGESSPATAFEAQSTFDPATGYGIRVVGPDPAPPAATGFEAQRGQLALPLSAPRAMREGTREDGSGLELDGGRGVPVRAASGGRVAFSDRHPAYGRLVILDHGGGYFTVYGGLARASVETGDQLSRGMEVGALDGEPLFFQVRRGTRPLDARSWLGL